MRATVFEIAGEVRSTPLIKGMGTKRLGKGRVNPGDSGQAFYRLKVGGGGGGGGL